MERTAFATQPPVPRVRHPSLSPTLRGQVTRPHLFSKPTRLNRMRIGKQAEVLDLCRRLLRVIHTGATLIAVRPRMALRHHPGPHIVALT